jgi:hypothetical protein
VSGRLLAPVAVIALAAVAAGCGASSKPAAAPATTTTTTAASSTAARRQLPAAFLACLRQHGVTLPAGGFERPRGFGTGTRPQGTFPTTRPAPTPAQQKRRAAFTACRKYAPQGFGFGRFGGARGGQFTRYVACMKRHGTTIGPSAARVDLTSPKFRAAAKQCRALLPSTGAGAPATGSQG